MLVEHIKRLVILVRAKPYKIGNYIYSRLTATVPYSGTYVVLPKEYFDYLVSEVERMERKIEEMRKKCAKLSVLAKRLYKYEVEEIEKTLEELMEKYRKYRVANLEPPETLVKAIREYIQFLDLYHLLKNKSSRLARVGLSFRENLLLKEVFEELNLVFEY